VDSFGGNGANNGERFRSEELRQAGANFDERFHILGDQKRFEKSDGCIAETAKNETKC